MLYIEYYFNLFKVFSKQFLNLDSAVRIYFQKRNEIPLHILFCSFLNANLPVFRKFSQLMNFKFVKKLKE